MITAHRIGRLLDAGAHDRLLVEVLRNGREAPLAARLRLSAVDALGPVATGLALRRLAELTHRPCRAAQEHAAALLDAQESDGRFGPLAATIAALCGLLALSRQCDARPGVAAPDFVQRLDRAVDLGLHVLFDAQRAGGAEEAAGLVGDAMDSALLLWLLGDEPRLREAVRVRDLVEAIRTSSGADDPQIGAVLALARDGGQAERGARRIAA